MNRIAPFAQQDLILYNTQLTQQRVFKAQLQLGSGKVSQDYAGIAQRAARLVSIEAAILRVQQFTQTISLVDQRLSLADIAMQSIDDIARQLRGIVKSLDDAPAERYSELREFAINARTVIVESLNTSDATRHLFGGTRIDTPPVDVSSPYRNVSLIQAHGAVDQTFYDSYYVEVLGNTLPYAQGSFYQQIYFDKNGVLPTVPVPADLNNPTLAEFVAEDPALWQYYVDRIDSTQMLITQVDNLARDAEFQGLNLVNGSGSVLKVELGKSSLSSLNINSVDLRSDSTGLNITAAASFSLSSLVDAAITELDAAATTLRSNASTLGSNVGLLQTRLDFTNKYVNDLTEGAGKLTLADINEEGANLVALLSRTRFPWTQNWLNRSVQGGPEHDR